MLFAELPIPSDAAEHLARRSRMCAPWFLAVQVLRRFGVEPPPAAPAPQQVPMPMVLRELDRDDVADPLPVHRLLAAADAPPLQGLGVSSVFGLADAAKAAKALRSLGRFGAAEPQALPPLLRVERFYADGAVRVIRQRPEETAEWQEREERRRAKQRPPKPTAKAKTRGKKVRAWDGEEFDD